ncbi:hypothetical protein [Sphingosinicella sp. CPCC 101087]|uniref:hypothetical protein n=1 Tax=Sphingosinicella sp. CPCC 101087 TaxID=2497754 RepID=UPI0013EA4EDA|nr:hypothetical protein [Sphingosinicella sp. CPCC 101087]
MEPLIYVMAILGCGESDAPCREVTVAEARYESEAACVAATEAELLRRDDLLFPSVVAQCRPGESRPQLLRGSDVLLPDPAAGRHAPPRFASAEPGRDRP